MNNNNHDKHIADALNECFESMIKGESLDSCLARHPECVAELRPLLQTMQTARSVSSISPDASFRAKARYDLRTALYTSVSHTARSAFSLRRALISAEGLAGEVSPIQTPPA